MEQRVCKQCLVKDMNQKDFHHKIITYINAIQEDIKTESQMYESRLNICRKCSRLINGMCSICGCFVELRAAIRTNHCPSSDRNW